MRQPPWNTQELLIHLFTQQRFTECALVARHGGYSMYVIDKGFVLMEFTLSQRETDNKQIWR